jgi:hypothetical protein
VRKSMRNVAEGSSGRIVTASLDRSSRTTVANVLTDGGPPAPPHRLMDVQRPPLHMGSPCCDKVSVSA